MEIERAAVHRALRTSRAHDLNIIRSGIGKEAIVAALERACIGARPALVILAGACGALRTTDEVPVIARIIDEHGRCWTSGVGLHPNGVTLIAVDRIVGTPAEKKQLAASSGASIVDMESHAFAAACERIGVAWSVVRGVSDTVDEVLPERVLHWIAADGRTRTLCALADLVRRPSLIPHVWTVLARSRRVLPSVGARVAELHGRWSAEPR